MTTSAEGVLLDAAAHLVDNLAAQPDHMKRIQHSDGVGQSVVDRVGIPAEGVERSSLNAVDELVGLVAEPAFVDASGAADDGVQQSGVQASGLVTREINHDGDGPIDPDPRRPPDVLINSKGVNAVQPGWVAGPGLGLHLDRIPTGVIGCALRVAALADENGGSAGDVDT